MLVSYLKNVSTHCAGLLLLALAVPFPAHAEILSKAVGIFNIFVGLMLTTAIVTYAVGLIQWACRLGSWPSYRTVAIKVMEWAVVILFVLVVLLTIVQFIQNNAESARYVLSVLAVLIAIGVGVVVVAQSGASAKPPSPEEHA